MCGDGGVTSCVLCLSGLVWFDQCRALFLPHPRGRRPLQVFTHFSFTSLQSRHPPREMDTTMSVTDLDSLFFLLLPHEPAIGIPFIEIPSTLVECEQQQHQHQHPCSVHLLLFHPLTSHASCQREIAGPCSSESHCSARPRPLHHSVFTTHCQVGKHGVSIDSDTVPVDLASR